MIKKMIAIGGLLLATFFGYGQTTNAKYDAALAQQLGADAYGMKNYVLVLLKTGPNTTTDKEFIAATFAGHMKNINKLVADKKLIVAGPFRKNEDGFRGLFILAVATLEEAQALVLTDPAVKEKLLTAECIPWYGSAALSEYLPIHDKIWIKTP